MAEMLIGALLIAGWVMVYIVSQREVKRACASLRFELQRQIDSLSETVKALERSATAQPHRVTGSGEITADTLAEIDMTITGLIGKKAMIRSVKLLQTPNAAANQWAQQGRVVVQASHNLAQRGREV